MDNLQDELVYKFYYQMYLIRYVERRLFELYSQGLFSGTIHVCLGQEACAVGVINALALKKDIIFSNHRAHGHFLAYSGDVYGIVAEILGQETGVCGGIGGSQHLHTKNMYTNGVQGGIVPNAVGAALAEKINGSGAISVVFFGDGTMGQGIVYESFNLASLWRLPVLFVLEDNQYAQSTPKEKAHAGSLITRADTYGIQSTAVDGNDVIKVYQTTLDAVQIVRNHSKPYFLVLNTYRLGPHSKGDDDRSSEELDLHWEADPLKRLSKKLPLPKKNNIEREIEDKVEAIIKQAIEDSPMVSLDFIQRVL